VTCERCGEREGEIRYTEYVDGEMRRSLICRSCAQELGFGEGGERPEAGPASGGQILGVVKIQEALRDEAAPPPDTRLCPRCGSTAADLDDNSLFGCPACYEAFDESLEALFRRVHGRVRHRGRIPGGLVDAPVDDAEEAGGPGEEDGGVGGAATEDAE